MSVLDASAVLALFHDEVGTEQVAAATTTDVSVEMSRRSHDRTRDVRFMAPGAALPAAGGWLVPQRALWDTQMHRERRSARRLVAALHVLSGGQHTELIPIRIGHDHPADLALADVDAS